MEIKKNINDDNGKNIKKILIDNSYYDVSDLKHPGGSIIENYVNNDIDATQSFRNFHLRSKKADKYLNSRFIKNKDSSKKNTILEDYNILLNELIEKGYFEPDYYHIFYRITEIYMMHLLGYLLYISNSYLYNIIGIFILGIASGRCGWLMHEAGHYSLTGSIHVDRGIQNIIYGIGCGMSSSWWRNQHNKHHSMPQKQGVDPDLNTLPLIAFNKQIINTNSKTLKLWIKIQAYMFPMITCLLVALSWQFIIHPRHIIRKKKISECITIFIRFFLWNYFFTAEIGILKSLSIYLLYNWVAATYIFINFSVSHSHLPIVSKKNNVNWVRYASEHTMNVSPGSFGIINWWMSYLNFQIEHHLFPSLPQFRLPNVSNKVKQLFKKHNITYIETDYINSLFITFKNLNNIGKNI